jgi:hypothetical protein
LKQRSSVDLPQPDGPMMAVTARCGAVIVTLLTAATLPKYALRSLVAMQGLASSAMGAGSTARSCTTGVTARGDWIGRTSVDWSTEP